MTFTKWALEESDGLVDDLNGILTRAIEERKTVQDPEALKMLTSIQASLIVARTRAGDMRRHFQSAQRNGEGRDLEAPKIDRKRAAAADTDTEQEVLHFIMPSNE